MSIVIGIILLAWALYMLVPAFIYGFTRNEEGTEDRVGEGDADEHESD